MAIKIDEMRKTLVITAGFKKKASVFNSEEYTLLRQAKNENPGFKVEVRKAKRKNSPKLTLDFMRRYIDDLPDTEKKVNHSHFFRRRQKRIYPRQNFGQTGLIHSVPFSVINERSPKGVILNVAD